MKNCSSAEPVYRLQSSSTQTLKRSEIFKTDHLGEFLTTKDIEIHYRIKAQRIRDIICVCNREQKPLPFTVLRGRPHLLERTSFETWLLKQSNAVAVPTETSEVSA